MKKISAICAAVGKKMKKIVAVCTGAAAGVVSAMPAHAAFTLPALPTADVEAAGTSVAALIAVSVVIGVIFRMMKKA